jgi:hypothetical protein
MPPPAKSWAVAALGVTAVAVGIAALAIASNDARIKKREEDDILREAEEKKERLRRLFNQSILSDADASIAPATRTPAERRDLWLQLSNEATKESISQIVVSSFELSALKIEYSNLTRALLEPRSKLGEEGIRNIDAISRDVGRTFSAIYGRDYQSQVESMELDRGRLTRILGAYSLRDSSVGYVQGMNFIAAFALSRVGNDEALAYALLVRLLNAPRYSMRNLYLPSLPHVKVWGYVLKSIIWQALPDIAAHLETVGVDPIFFFEWYFALFVLILPPDICAEAWDDFLRDGWSSAFRIILCLLSILEPHLLGKDFYGTLLSLKAYSNSRTLSENQEGNNREGMLAITPPRGLIALSRKHFEIFTGRERLDHLERLGLKLVASETRGQGSNGRARDDLAAAGFIGHE